MACFLRRKKAIGELAETRVLEPQKDHSFAPVTKREGPYGAENGLKIPFGHQGGWARDHGLHVGPLPCLGEEFSRPGSIAMLPMLARWFPHECLSTRPDHITPKGEFQRFPFPASLARRSDKPIGCLHPGGDPAPSERNGSSAVYEA